MQETNSVGGKKSAKEKLPLTEEGGTPIEESDLGIDELSEIYIPAEDEEDSNQ